MAACFRCFFGTPFEMTPAAMATALRPDSRIETLRALLPAPLPIAPGMATGIEALDRALASGGFPRGRLTEVVGPTGRLTLLRQVVQAALNRGEWVAYIDASRTLA